MKKEIIDIPVLPLRGVTIFPEMIMHFDVGRLKSLKAVNEAMKQDAQIILAVAQKDADVDEPTEKDLYQVGTLVQIKQMSKIGESQYKLIVKGTARAKILSVEDTEYMVASAEVLEEAHLAMDIEEQALLRSVSELFEKYAELNPRISDEILYGILGLKDNSQFIDVIIGHVLIEVDKKQEILACIDIKERMFKTIGILTNEIEILSLQKDIFQKVKANIDQSQKEYYLREQKKIIEEQLGDKEGIQADIDGYKKKIEALTIPQVIQEKLNKEIKRLGSIPTSSPESGNTRTYIETVLDLPWDNFSKENLDLKKATTILNKDHYGLEKVKERIVEYLAVKKLSDTTKPPILCLVGPPGVGKTSIAKAIAGAMGRKCVRISLGGVRDEAEIRGHRRTYVGAIPGRFVYGLTEAGTMNPVMLLDEIDKMSGDFKGDPASALLEILDANQNSSFKDHYLEIPLDLSKVLFIATANTLAPIPKPLLDRMEILEVSSYTVLEKIEIGYKYLLPNQLELHHLTNKNLRLTKTNLKFLIEHYTREAGVRGLERTLAKICRKVAKEMVETGAESIQVTPSKLKEYLGSFFYEYEEKNNKPEIGVVRGLAWTSVGGDTLSIEVNVVPGKGKLELTGQMGDVMKESAKAAISFIRAKSSALHISDEFYLNQDVHIHIPEGAVPKDGPSAGITMATAIISALTKKPVLSDLAMTGEITIRGRVLPIGGLKEKLLAAKRAKIQQIIVPVGNKKNVEELDKHILEGLEITFAQSMEDVLAKAFV